jgi:superfamily II DNA or RNA helicase/RecB family exonuclease
MKQRINLSASSMNCYRDSELLFYYNYIKKLDPDTDTVECYGAAGNVVHTVIEEFVEEKLSGEYDVFARFETLWNEKKLHILRGMNGSPLCKDTYFAAVNRGITKVKELRNDNDVISLVPELKFEEKLYEGKNFVFYIKGFIDVVVEKSDGVEVIDWKTSSSVSNGFELQGLHYAYALHKLYKNIESCTSVFEYVKINETKEYTFTHKDFQQHEKNLVKLAKEIDSKGDNINKYSIGDVSSIFNNHAKKCAEEVKRRNSAVSMVAEIKNNRIFLSNIDEEILKLLYKKYSYTVDGAHFSEAFKKRRWDGKKYLITKESETTYSLPMGFFRSLQQFINDYNEYYSRNVDLFIKDNRNQAVINKELFVSQSRTKVLRYYQEEAVEAALKKKHGILYLGTGAGKTVIATELMRRLKRRTLFVVNRVELAEQTAAVLKEELQQNIAVMTEGKLEYNTITVASIQTICAIMKRRDESSRELFKYLANVVVTFFDEAQNVADANMYGVLSRTLINNVYMFGLSGSPWRNGADSLELNALCGDIIYTKTTEELEKEGFLCPTKCFFVDVKTETAICEDTYADAYNEGVVHNEKRNAIITNIVNFFSNKNKKILLLTRRVEHAHLLSALIANSRVITGATASAMRKEIFGVFKNTSDAPVLIGSTKIFSAGIDIPDLDVIINAAAHKSSIDTVQIVGRVKRKNENKKFGYYIDFIDYVKYLSKASMERNLQLAKQGNTVVDCNNEKILFELVEDIEK